MRITARFRTLLTALLVTVLAFGPVGGAFANGGISLIRDAEIEGTLRRMSGPIFEAAGLGANAVDIYIVNDERLNAFVAGGQNLFLNTGLLMRADRPTQLLGVVAHETGHIAGGHLSRVPGAQRRAAAEMILSTVLGAAAAVAGAPDVGAAVMSGGMTYAQGNLMAFSRSQEQAADQAALRYLEQAGVSPRGLLDVFKLLESQNALAVSASSPYLRSHPLTRDRMLFVENHVAQRQAPADAPEPWADAHRRMVVKLDAFLREPRQALERYKNDDSLTGRYGRAIALYRLPDLRRALVEIDALLAEHPEDPYFHELKGQMLFEHGQVANAIAPYREAVRLKPDAPLLRIGLAQALIESGQPEANQASVGQLEEAIRGEPRNASAWRLLGIAQGREGREGPSSLALAEYALLVGKNEDARLYARRAQAKLDPSDPTWLRLQDILRVIEEG